MELELLNKCKDYISVGSNINCSKLGDKPFCYSSLDTRRLIIDDIAVHYNTKILDKTVCGCHLVRGNKDTEGIGRWKCSNYLNKCHAAIWINKKGELHDTTSTHKECCKASDDASNKTIQMNGFIQTNRDAYERSIYHLQCIKSIVKHVSSDNLYTYFVTYMRDIEKLEVNSMWRNSLSHKLWYDVDKLVHNGVKRLDQTQALVTYLESNSEHYIKFVSVQSVKEEMMQDTCKQCLIDLKSLKLHRNPQLVEELLLFTSRAKELLKKSEKRTIWKDRC